MRNSYEKITSKLKNDQLWANLYILYGLEGNCKKFLGNLQKLWGRLHILIVIKKEIVILSKVNKKVDIYRYITFYGISMVKFYEKISWNILESQSKSL